MKKVIISLEKDWLAFIYGIMGILLIIFPLEFTGAIPYMLGFGLIAHGIIAVIAACKYKKEASVKAGKIIIYFALGAAILYHEAEAIGPIGAIWAMMSLTEAAEEITEEFEKKRISVLRLIAAAVTIALAIILLFDPFEHFTFHVRILGLEMLSAIFVRRHKIIRSERDVAVEA